MNNTIQKAFGLPEAIDPAHEYIYKTGEHDIYQYWYRDHIGNYWEYTNAPEDSPDYDPLCGSAFLSPDQPMPHIAPQFYTPEGYKRSMGVPDGVELESNDAYDPTSPSEVWYEMYTDPEGNSRFVYLDADVRESLDLWVQQQLRVVDAGLPAYRKYASELFLSDNEKDRSLGTVLILIDQATYDIEELVYAACSDCEFIDNTVKLLGRKFICDPDMLDYLTEKVAQKEPEAPLFTMTTMLGEEVLGIRYLASIFQALKMNPRFIRHWHANHQFSRIVHRMASQRVPMEQMEELAYNELARVLATSEDVRFLIDYKVRDTLFNNYPTEAEDTPPKNPNEDEEQVEKSLKHVPTDDFGVAQVWSDLTTRRPDERDFSEWLHSEPLHEVSPEQQEALDETEEVKKDFDDANEAAEAGEDA